MRILPPALALLAASLFAPVASADDPEQCDGFRDTEAHGPCVILVHFLEDLICYDDEGNPTACGFCLGVDEWVGPLGTVPPFPQLAWADREGFGVSFPSENFDEFGLQLGFGAVYALYTSDNNISLCE